MTDSDARLRNQLRWTVHALLLAGLGLVLLLVSVYVLGGLERNDPKYIATTLAAVWGFFAVYAGGTSAIVRWKATTWLHTLLVHVAAVGSIALGALAIGAFFLTAVR